MLQPDLRVVGGHQLGGAALLSVGPDRGHQRHRGARHDGGSAVEHAATLGQISARRGIELLFHRQGFAGQG